MYVDWWEPFGPQSSQLFPEIWFFRKQDGMGEEGTVFEGWGGAKNTGYLW